MKALSISTPWPSAIEHYGKRVENRPRWLPHAHLMAQARRMVGQRIAIQSSKTHDRGGEMFILNTTGHLYTRRDIPRGAITSVATVSALILPGDPCPAGQEDWYFGSVALLLDDVRVLPEPVAFKGGLGWLNVQEPELSQVMKQLESWGE